MRQLATAKSLLFAALLLLLSSVAIAVVSLYPLVTDETETQVIIDDSFKLTPLEMWRHGLGSFHEGTYISISVHKAASLPLNFSIQTYNGTCYSTVCAADIAYSFTAGTDYYEAVFFTDSNTTIQVDFEVSVQMPMILFPYSCLSTPAKILFFSSLGSVMLLLLPPAFNRTSMPREEERIGKFLSRKSYRILLFLILMSLAFWLFLLAVNTNCFAAFENWYTDQARNPYSSSLFTKVGFSIFDTPLGELASGDSSCYKFITWPQMPHLYPLGSVLLFFPFGFLLQSGVNQVFVFKTEIVVFLLFSHFSLYYFLQRFWKRKMFPLLKLLAIYALYVPLIVYSANGMFDAVPFLFSLIALTMYLNERYDDFLLLMGLSLTFKYQPALFLLPLIIMGAIKLYSTQRLSGMIRNKKVIAAAIFAVISGFTAVSSASFLMETRPELMMNGVNAFSSHPQLPWVLQSFAVLSTLAVTLLFAVYMLKRNPLLSLSAIFVLLPTFTLPYFQIWYLPFFLLYAFVPKQKRETEITVLWLLFMITMLSFGGISFNPLHIVEGWNKVLGF